MSNIKLFENKKIRVVWDEDKEDYYFSVVDVISILTTSENYQVSRNYWKVLKSRLKAEGSELVTNCNRLKFTAQDGKLRETDALDTKGILRLIQSIPSPKAEPFKLWLAQVGSERLEEIGNPEKAILRGVDYYKNKGYEESWITQRMHSIGIRKELTDEWKNRGISEEKDYAILTNEMLKAWSGMTVKEYKKVKGLKDESLRDNMSNLEIVLNMLAEVTTTEISKKEKPDTFEENKKVAKRGGKVARSAKIEYEKEVEVKDMKENLKYERLDKKDISEEEFKQIMDVENSTGSGYSEDVMRRMWLEDEKNSNFVCKCNNKIVAIISYNPLSKRRNGSIYMVNLTVHPEYRKAGIAQNLIYTACKYYEKENNNLPMSLQVDKDNIPAINLYKKVGFKIEEPICEADEDDEQYIMEADIEELVKNIQKIQNKNIKR